MLCWPLRMGRPCSQELASLPACWQERPANCWLLAEQTYLPARQLSQEPLASLL